MRTRARVVLPVLLLGLVPSLAWATGEADRGQARELGKAAYAAAAAGDWAKAEELFAKADALYHAPSLLLGLARAHAHLGKYVEAYEEYHRILVETLPPNAAPALRKAVEDAKAEIGSVEGKRSKATIIVTGATSPKVTLDGVDVPAAGLGSERAVNPGSHVVHVEAVGMKTSDTTFTVAEGASTTTNVTLVPDASATPAPGSTPATAPPADGTTPTAASEGSPLRTVGLITMGVGAAGLLTGAITGIVAVSQHGSLTSNACANAGCGPTDLMSYQSDVSTFHTMGTISTVGFIAGGVLAAGGAVLFFTAPKRENAGTTGGAGMWVTPTVGGASVGASGTF
jgi:hypothetical protein